MFILKYLQRVAVWLIAVVLVLLLAVLSVSISIAGSEETPVSNPIDNPAQWYRTKELDEFYRQIARSIKQGNPIVMVTYCGMWIDCKSPEENLHLGARFGPQRMLEIASKKGQKDPKVARDIGFQFEHDSWEEIHTSIRPSDPIRIAVYKLSVEPNEKWKALGVTEVFEIYNVLLAYSDLKKAGVDSTLNLKQDKGLVIPLQNGKIDLGEDAAIIGYNSHNFYYDGDFDGIRRIRCHPDSVKGVFVVGCNTKQYFRDDLIGRNIYGLLFTTSFMAPEGYVLLALSDAIAQAKSGREIVRQCNSSYRFFQEKYAEKKPGPLFVNHAYGLFTSKDQTD